MTCLRCGQPANSIACDDCKEGLTRFLASAETQVPIQGGGRLPRFIAAKSMSEYIGPELRQKLENPLIFQGLDTVSGDRLWELFKEQY